MLKPAIYIRCDANSVIGMGHLIRSSALADMLKDYGRIHFIFRNTADSLIRKYLHSSYHVLQMDISFCEEVDYYKHIFNFSEQNILILDGYDFDSAYQLKCRKIQCKLVYVDDLVNFNYSCDVLINQADMVKTAQYSTKEPIKFCLGPAYALLRPAFLEIAQQPIRNIKTISSVFISFGGADTYNITYKALKVIAGIPGIDTIHVLSGPVNVNEIEWRKEFNKVQTINFHANLQSVEVCKLMNECQLALCPSSSLALELCAVGVFMVIGITADNQEGYYRSFLNNKIALGVGNWQDCDENSLSEKILEIQNYTHEQFTTVIENQRKYIDGKSGERIRSVFNELLNGI